MFYSLPNPNLNGDEDGISINTQLIKDIIEGRSIQDLSRPVDKKAANHAKVVHEFMIMLSVCHTVIPEKIDETIIYHAASPGNVLLYQDFFNIIFNLVFDIIYNLILYLFI